MPTREAICSTGTGRVLHDPRTGRNPRTGEAVEVSAKSVPYFKPGKELRERINKPAPAAARVPARALA